MTNKQNIKKPNKKSKRGTKISQRSSQLSLLSSKDAPSNNNENNNKNKNNNIETLQNIPSQNTIQQKQEQEQEKENQNNTLTIHAPQSSSSQNQNNLQIRSPRPSSQRIKSSTRIHSAKTNNNTNHQQVKVINKNIFKDNIRILSSPRYRKNTDFNLTLTSPGQNTQKTIFSQQQNNNNNLFKFNQQQSNNQLQLLKSSTTTHSSTLNTPPLPQKVKFFQQQDQIQQQHDDFYITEATNISENNNNIVNNSSATSRSNKLSSKLSPYIKQQQHQQENNNTQHQQQYQQIVRRGTTFLDSYCNLYGIHSIDTDESYLNQKPSKRTSKLSIDKSDQKLAQSRQSIISNNNNRTSQLSTTQQQQQQQQQTTRNPQATILLNNNFLDPSPNPPKIHSEQSPQPSPSPSPTLNQSQQKFFQNNKQQTLIGHKSSRHHNNQKHIIYLQSNTYREPALEDLNRLETEQNHMLLTPLKTVQPAHKHAEYAKNVIQSKEAELSQLEIDYLYKYKCDDMKISQNLQVYEQFCHSLKSRCQNQVLDLENMQIGPHSITHICKIIQKNRKFSKLYIGQNDLNDDQKSKLILTAIKKNPNFISLKFSNNNLSAQGMNSLLDFCQSSPTIINLNISNKLAHLRNKMNHHTYKGLRNLVQNNNIMMFLNLDSCFIGNKGLYQLCQGLKQNKTLLYLNLNNNDLSKESGQIFKESLHHTCIQDIRLKSNKFRDQGMDDFMEILQSNSRTFQPRYVSLSKVEMTEKGLMSLLQGIQYSNCIVKLKLSKNNFFCNDMIFLGNFLCEQKTLLHLDLSKSQMTSAGIDQLSWGLRSNQFLQSLNLQQNVVQDKGAIALGEALKLNNSLKYLNLKKTQIQDTGALAIVDGLVEKNIYFKIDLRTNLFQDIPIQKAIISFKKNPYILEFNISENMVNLQVQQELDRIILQNLQTYNQKQIPTLKRECKNLKGLDYNIEAVQEKYQQCMTSKHFKKKLINDILNTKKKEIIDSDKQFHKIQQEYDNLHQKYMEYDEQYHQNEFEYEKHINDLIQQQRDIDNNIEKINHDSLSLQTKVLDAKKHLRDLKGDLQHHEKDKLYQKQKQSVKFSNTKQRLDFFLQEIQNFKQTLKQEEPKVVSKVKRGTLLTATVGSLLRKTSIFHSQDKQQQSINSKRKKQQSIKQRKMSKIENISLFSMLDKKSHQKSSMQISMDIIGSSNLISSQQLPPKSKKKI